MAKKNATSKRNHRWDLIEDPAAEAKKLRTEISNLEGGYRRGLRDALIQGYAIALRLAKDEGEWKAFVADPVWNDGARDTKRPVADDQEEALKFVFEYAFESQTKQGYNRTHKYIRAFERRFRKQVDPRRVYKTLKKIGIEEMYKEACRLDPKHRKRATGGASSRSMAAKSSTKSPRRSSAEELIVQLNGRLAKRASQLTEGAWIKMTVECVAETTGTLGFVAKTFKMVKPADEQGRTVKTRRRKGLKGGHRHHDE